MVTQAETKQSSVRIGRLLFVGLFRHLNLRSRVLKQTRYYGLGNNSIRNAPAVIDRKGFMIIIQRS